MVWCPENLICDVKNASPVTLRCKFSISPLSIACQCPLNGEKKVGVEREGRRKAQKCTETILKQKNKCVKGVTLMWSQNVKHSCFSASIHVFAFTEQRSFPPGETLLHPRCEQTCKNLDLFGTWTRRDRKHRREKGGKTKAAMCDNSLNLLREKKKPEDNQSVIKNRGRKRQRCGR